ncbi:hypothetical protein GIB67_040351 [Kingdonia uniflora]|uniref:Uncharacterized protein n=1 Tax=Kingdonia uniflora TaxID=39325 RepID=A0A7J7L9I1_9MAGN|nr:hypothetical protein GIB67_040351 [Kingdonia uniflora]
MCLKIIHQDIIYCSCRSSDNNIIGGVEPIEDHLLQIRIRYGMLCNCKTIHKSLGL